MYADPQRLRLPSLNKDDNGSKVQISRPRIIERCVLNRGPAEPNTVGPDSAHKTQTLRNKNLPRSIAFSSTNIPKHLSPKSYTRLL